MPRRALARSTQEALTREIQGTGSRRRGAALEDALLEAAWAELLDVGYRDLTMEGIARRAGTSKPVIYRRWSSRVEVVIAALLRRSSSIVDRIPDTGSLRDDTLSVLLHMNKRFSDIPAGVRRGLITDAFAEVNLLDESPARDVMARVMRVILDRAADRGEIPRVKFSQRVVRLPADLLRHEMMITDSPASERVIREIVDEIFLPLVTEPRRGGRREPVGGRRAPPMRRGLKERSPRTNPIP